MEQGCVALDGLRKDYEKENWWILGTKEYKDR